MNNFKFYYGNYNFQHKIIKYLFNREFAVLPAKRDDADIECKKRNLRIHNTQSFQFWLERLKLFDRNRFVNMYYSMAKYGNGVPRTNPHTFECENKEWNAEHKENIASFDMPIDIDAGDFNDMEYAVLSADSLKIKFDEWKIPYYLRFSGMGFHFVIPYNYFPEKSCNPDDDDNVYELMMRIAQGLHDDFSEMIDKSIYDSRRLLKLPYSLSLYNENTYVCMPVSDLKSFNINDYLMEKYLSNSVFKEDVLHNLNGSIKILENRYG